MRLDVIYIARLLMVALLIAGLSITAIIASAEAAEGFSNASLKGDYATVNIGRGGYLPQAGISVASYDGKGNFSGTTIQNLPGTDNRGRVFLKTTFNGKYLSYSSPDTKLNFSIS